MVVGMESTRPTTDEERRLVYRPTTEAERRVVYRSTTEDELRIVYDVADRWPQS